MSEWSLIQHVRQNSPKHPLLRLGIGDDAAVLASHPREILAACDTILDGSHFDARSCSGRDIGHKAVAVNLSDIAAMGGVAESILIALSVPKPSQDGFLKDIFSGIQAICEEFHVAIAGGDTTAWQGPLALTVTVLGRPHVRCGPILRSGARPGDAIYVTGPLGDSLASGHHLRFRPRLDEVKALCDLITPTSMIDLSDGLAGDLGHICQASRVGASLERQAIPLRPSLAGKARSVALEQALTDGEDFELCFTVATADTAQLEGLPFPLHRIGSIIEKPGLRWEDKSPISSQGFQHQFN